MKKLLVVGYYGTNVDPFGGQQIKTKEITESLSKYYNIRVIDTTGWKKKKILLGILFLFGLIQYKKIIILPAHNGAELFFKIFKIIKNILKRHIYYIVIGGWLPELLENKKQYLNTAKSYTKILVETSTMKRKLNNLGLSNIVIMHNFKDMIPVDFEKYEKGGVYKFCVFSRVVEKKGIMEAIDAIIELVKDYGINCTLDIYGNIDDVFREVFLSKIEMFPKIVFYKGVVDNRSSIQILKKYYMQIFATKFYTEGIPGSIIDSYFSGLPVLASRWESSGDIILEGITGLTFEFLNFKDLVEKLYYCVTNEQHILGMRQNCIIESTKYSKQFVVKTLLEVLDDDKT